MLPTTPLSYPRILASSLLRNIRITSDRCTRTRRHSFVISFRILSLSSSTRQLLHNSPRRLYTEAYNKHIMNYWLWSNPNRSLYLPNNHPSSPSSIPSISSSANVFFFGTPPLSCFASSFVIIHIFGSACNLNPYPLVFYLPVPPSYTYPFPYLIPFLFPPLPFPLSLPLIFFSK